MKTTSIVAGIAVALLFAVTAPAAYAGPVKITQTMTKSQLKKSCDANGGLYSDNGKYGSSCIGNGGIVGCNTKGKCTGYLPD